MAGASAAAVYVRAMRADAQVHARSADSALARELLDIAQRQLDVGVGVALDVTRARAQLAGIRSQLIGARGERDRSRLELTRVLGLDGATPLSLRDSLSPGSPADSIPGEAAAIALAQGRRSDLSVAAAATETAKRGLWAVRAERLPSMGVFGDDGLTSNSYSHLLGTYTYGFQVTLPVFEGFRAQSHSRQAEALLHEAQARQHDVELQVATDVRSAVIELASSREQVGAAQERLTLGEQELSQARERFRAGVAGNADIIIAQLNLTQARSQYVDALAALQMARVSLARAQGRVTELP
jgi:outer membrane protein TolC